MTLPSSPAESSQSPTPSTSELTDPPRKRSRSDISPDERKEARAHRNRIAAQNSRDRRKAQFVYLERRVVELEEENRQLRAGMGLTGLHRAEEDKVEEQRERDTARDRENEELRARIKTLETGWEAVVKALAASGLPLSIPSAPPSSSLSDSSLSSQPSTSALPVLVPQPSASVFPLSPALSQAPSPRSSTPIYPLDFDDSEPTRHLARVATTDAPLLSSVSLQRVGQTSRRTRIPTSNPSSSFPGLPHIPLRHQSHRDNKTHCPPWTKSPWTNSSARSLRPRPFCRQRLFLLVTPTPSARGRTRSHYPNLKARTPFTRPCRPRPPGPRRR